jgi:hypothetical protein
MGAFIKDMEKPKNCGECPLMRGSYCAITDNFYFGEADYDPTSCPIEEIDLVRCGECKHLKADGTCNMFADDNIRPSASDFCSYGERRNDE